MKHIKRNHYDEATKDLYTPLKQVELVNRADNDDLVNEVPEDDILIDKKEPSVEPEMKPAKKSKKRKAAPLPEIDSEENTKVEDEEVPDESIV
jgi:hypothetical protein